MPDPAYVNAGAPDGDDDEHYAAGPGPFEMMAGGGSPRRKRRLASTEVPRHRPRLRKTHPSHSASLEEFDLLMTKASEQQVGGSHYKDCPIQPGIYAEKNRLSFWEGCVVKRVTRHRKAGGKGRQDIEKAIHELQLILEEQYDELG